MQQINEYIQLLVSELGVTEEFATIMCAGFGSIVMLVILMLYVFFIIALVHIIFKLFIDKYYIYWFDDSNCVYFAGFNTKRARNRIEKKYHRIILRCDIYQDKQTMLACVKDYCCLNLCKTKFYNEVVGYEEEKQ